MAPIFQEWLEHHVPGKKDRSWAGSLDARGKLDDPRFGARMRGEGIFAERISQMFHVACHKARMPEDAPGCPRQLFAGQEGSNWSLISEPYNLMSAAFMEPIDWMSGEKKSACCGSGPAWRNG